MIDNTMLFDQVFEQALGESPHTLMEKHAAAVARGDWERVRLIDEMVRLAAVLGTNAVSGQLLSKLFSWRAPSNERTCSQADAAEGRRVTLMVQKKDTTVHPVSATNSGG
jgi:hypothetical protein